MVEATAVIGLGQPFTSRPELRGTFGMVSSTHWIASAAGMRMLELGGNAFDAATAAGLVLQVVQPHLNGAGGDLPVIIWDARVGEPEVLCAQGVAPNAATPDRFRAYGLDTIPGTGVLAACVPGAMDGWLRLLLERGTLTLRQVMEPAIHYSGHGYPVSYEMARVIDSVHGELKTLWPESARTYLGSGSSPEPGSTFCNAALSQMYERLVREGESAGPDRDAQIVKARESFYRGFVAEAIDTFVQTSESPDTSGNTFRGLLSGDDLADWSATWERPLSTDFGNLTVYKSGWWSQGPVFLQQLRLLEHAGVRSMDPDGADYVHTVVEASKLAFADREAWYADPEFFDAPTDALLSDEYARQRSALIGDQADMAQRPGRPDAREPVMPLDHRPRVASAGTGEPTVEGTGGFLTDGEAPARPSDKEHVGDTCHVDVVDRFGNMVSATPSGGWLQSSPTIPGLGFALGTRMQMFDLDDGRPNQVQPGKRPRTTLSPTLALRDGQPWLAFGTPGGDQQDQWSLQFLLNVALRGDDLQMAIDRPVFHTAHFASSFYPRHASPGRVYIEDRFPDSTIRGLKRRGHDVRTTGPWSLTRVCAAGQLPDGTLRAAANPRGMEAYAAGR